MSSSVNALKYSLSSLKLAAYLSYSSRVACPLWGGKNPITANIIGELSFFFPPEEHEYISHSPNTVTSDVHLSGLISWI